MHLVIRYLLDYGYYWNLSELGPSAQRIAGASHHHHHHHQGINMFSLQNEVDYEYVSK